VTTAQSGPAPRRDEGLEAALARVLQVGTYLSVGLVAIGAVLLIVGGTSPLAGGPPLSLPDLPADLLALRPAGFLWLGILGIVLTPGLRVAAALVGFRSLGERAMPGVAAVILAVVAAGVVIGVLAG
jgi:uncharacterized membrane protein